MLAVWLIRQETKSLPQQFDGWTRNAKKEIDDEASYQCSLHQKIEQAAISALNVKLHDVRHQITEHANLAAIHLRSVKDEISKELETYREELIESLHKVRLDTAAGIEKTYMDTVVDIKAAIAHLETRAANTASELQKETDRVFTETTTELRELMFDTARAIDIKGQGIQDRLLEIFPVEKKSVWMNMMKGGAWTNKMDTET